MSTPPAVIVMATYNGGGYLREQLDSLLAQTYGDWALYVSDDGSTDGSLDVLMEYADRDPRVHVSKNPGEHGAYANYYGAIERLREAVGNGPAYYLFCDQDDVWRSDKVELEVMRLRAAERELGEGCPLLCYSDLELVSGDGATPLGRMSDLQDISLEERPANVFFAHRYVWGTTVALNRALWSSVRPPTRRRNDPSHDNWYAKHAILTGHVIYLPEPLVRYRRHGGNVTELPRRYGLLDVARKAERMGASVDQQAHIFWSSLEAVRSSGARTPFARDLERVFNQGGLFAVRFMWRERVCPGGEPWPQVARYLNLGLGWYRRTRWYAG